MLRLNAQGWTVPVIAEIFECHEHTVRNPTTMATRGWGMGSRTGCKKWQEADLQTVEQWIEQDARTYNSHQLAQKLSEQRQVKLSQGDTFYKRALDGELVTATEASKTLSKTTQTSRPQYTVSCTRGLHRPEISGWGCCLWVPSVIVAWRAKATGAN